MTEMPKGRHQRAVQEIDKKNKLVFFLLIVKITCVKTLQMNEVYFMAATMGQVSNWYEVLTQECLLKNQPCILHTKFYSVGNHWKIDYGVRVETMNTIRRL